MNNSREEMNDDMQLETSAQSALMLILVAIAGALIAAVVVPTWMPGLVSSLLGPEPKAFWYLSRASGLVAYGLVWVSVALGLMVTNRMARVWPGGPFAADIHEFASLLGLAAGVFHALVLLGDRYSNYSLAQILLPFGGNTYRPLWVAAGQIGIYVSAVVSFSVYVRRWIGYRAWRVLHYASFFAFVATLTHGVMSGTDTVNGAVQTYYWLTGGSVMFLFVYRLLASKSAAPKKTAVAARRGIRENS